MNILVVSHEFPPIGGGGANACLFLTKGYAETGHKVVVVTVWYEGLKEHEYFNGVEIYRVKSKRSRKESCSFKEMFSYLLKATPLADKLVKKNAFDICQVFFGIPSGPIGYWLKKRYRLPYIIRFGGGDIPGFQERFKTVYKLISPFVKLIWKNAEGLVANSEGLREFALKFYDKKQIEVIYNGVDTDYFYPDSSKRDENVINLLFVSRLIERKGLQFVIPYLNDIQKSSTKRVQLTIVGDGPYRSTLEALVDQYNVRDKVIFAGQKNKDELLPYYQSGDVFVFPSKREGMPNAVLEAMACGLPIVISPCQGSKELVTENGRIAGDDLDVFHITLLNVIKMPAEELIRMGQISRNRVENEFSWRGGVADGYLSLFKQKTGKANR